MTKKTIALIPVSPADRSAFVAAIQEAFSAALKNHFPIGTSNDFLEGPVTVSVEKGTLLLMCCKKHG